jgi:hypothetical protein
VVIVSDRSPFVADGIVDRTISFDVRVNRSPDSLAVKAGGLDVLLAATGERSDLDMNEGVADRILVEELNSRAVDLKNCGESGASRGAPG